MSTSLVYRSAIVYEMVMRALYGRHYGDRLRAVAEQVPLGASVLELCPGPGALYRRHLRGRPGLHYTGIDLNPRFVARLRRMGAGAVVRDLSQPVELPTADVVIMQASLYHFLPDASAIVDRMLSAAVERVIVAEPIRNLSSSGVPILARLSRRGTDPGTGASHGRFDEAALDELMRRYADLTVAAFRIHGDREKVFVLDLRR